ncbi:MAG: crossover junction endodeoxyribonuclease RuvC [Holosporaceae bacterium]|nr:crossover junction endodeoxyribonuclease RuvC [Holosporaceae bacterium]
MASLKILGIDSGLHITGWGVIDYDGFHLKYVAHGVISSTASEEISQRLGNIFKGLADIIEEYSPSEAGIENTFVNKNPFSSLKLGMARGTAICCAGILGLKIVEYTPNKVKKSVVGTGHATKEQVSIMVQKLLNCGNVKLDAADALAVAICHAHHGILYRMAE